jgi:hypothetical protein
MAKQPNKMKASQTERIALYTVYGVMMVIIGFFFLVVNTQIYTSSAGLLVLASFTTISYMCDRSIGIMIGVILIGFTVYARSTDGIEESFKHRALSRAVLNKRSPPEHTQGLRTDGRGNLRSGIGMEPVNNEANDFLMRGW